MALSGRGGRAILDLRRSDRDAPWGVRFPKMAPTTRVTKPTGARPAPEAQAATAYRRAAAQRCWVCNAPDSEPVRLQRRAGARWVSEATVRLCTACLAAVATPRLIRQLDLGRATAAPPARPSPAEVAPDGHPSPGADAPDEPPPLTLLKGA